MVGFINLHLIFQSSKEVLSVYASDLLFLNQFEDMGDICCPTFKISVNVYSQGANNSFFNAKPDFWTSPKCSFLPDCPIQLEVILHPNLLPQLLEHAQTEGEAAAYLLALSQQHAEKLQEKSLEFTSPYNSESIEVEVHPLLYTENWFCLSVKQQQDDGEVGYTTFWNYVNPAMLKDPGVDSDRLLQGITQFLQDRATTNFTTATQDITEGFFKGITSALEGVETWLDIAFTDDAEEIEEDDDESILETVIDFFTEDDWSFTKLQGQSVLQLAFQGENGTWKCFAQAREDQKQFVFYSIYPGLVSPDQRLAIAEFLTRANYGVIIGNFEMDFDDGEIRYKTSIDVEDDVLTTELVKQLVYANVMMMDHYFPGLQMVMEGGVLPEAAIAHIEHSSENAAEF